MTGRPGAVAAVAAVDLRTTLVDRQTLFLFFALPLLFTLVLGRAFDRPDPGPATGTVTVWVAAEAADLGERLAGLPGVQLTDDPAAAQVRVEPTGDGAVLRGREARTLPLARLLAVRATPPPAGAPRPAIVQPQADPRPPERWRIARGMLAMFALFLLFGGGISLVEARETGLLDRLRVVAGSDATVLLGKLVGIVALGLVQITVLTAALHLFFGVPWGRSPAALALVVVAFVLAGTGVGLGLTSLTRTAAQAENLGVLAVLVLAALGGAWWPLDGVGAAARALAPASPVFWGLEGLRAVMVEGAGPAAVLVPVAVLLAFCAGGLLLGVVRLRRGTA